MPRGREDAQNKDAVLPSNGEFVAALRKEHTVVVVLVLVGKVERFVYRMKFSRAQVNIARLRYLALLAQG